jgi:hypothetical protein
VPRANAFGSRQIPRVNTQVRVRTWHLGCSGRPWIAYDCEHALEVAGPPTEDGSFLLVSKAEMPLGDLEWERGGRVLPVSLGVLEFLPDPPEDDEGPRWDDNAYSFLLI